jgi:8-oxo-dGTP pyrophosphatase MutT (NUDIX family)
VTPLHRDAVAVLTAYSPGDPAQAALRDDYLAFLAGHDDAMTRACVDGHLTASTAVLAHDRTHVLLTLHPKFDLWLQTGGHCEPGDATLREAAAREALEESGIVGLDLTAGPVALDRHRVRCHGTPWTADDPAVPFGTPGTCWHLDVQYAAVAPEGAEHVRSDESLDLRWWPVDALPEQTDDAVRRLVSAARTAPLV